MAKKRPIPAADPALKISEDTCLELYRAYRANPTPETALEMLRLCWAYNRQSPQRGSDAAYIMTLLDTVSRECHAEGFKKGRWLAAQAAELREG